MVGVLPIKTETTQRCHYFQYFKIVRRLRVTRQEKEITGVQIRKKELWGGGHSVGKALTSIGLEFKCLLPM